MKTESTNGMFNMVEINLDTKLVDDNSNAAMVVSYIADSNNRVKLYGFNPLIVDYLKGKLLLEVNDVRVWFDDETEAKEHFNILSQTYFLSDRIVATLNKEELKLLDFIVKQGRKYCIEVKFTNEDKSKPALQNTDYQFQQLINGNRNLPIYNENVIVSIIHTIEAKQNNLLGSCRS